MTAAAPTLHASRDIRRPRAGVPPRGTVPGLRASRYRAPRGLQYRQSELRELRIMTVDREAVACQADRRRQALGQRQLTVARGEMGEGGGRTGNGGGERAVDREPRHHLAVLVEIHVARGRERRALAAVDHDVM